MAVSGYLLISQKRINMEDKKLQFMKEERIRRFKTLIGLNENYDVREDAENDSMQEDGAPATSADPNIYPDLDDYVARLTLGVQNLITKELNKDGEDPEFPYKAEYIVSGLIKGLHQEIPLSEKAVSKAQQRFFGAVRGVQKGDTPADDVSPEIRQAAGDMSVKNVRDFAGTKTKRLPKKK